ALRGSSGSSSASRSRTATTSPACAERGEEPGLEVRGEPLRLADAAEVPQLRDFEIGEAARPDSPERLEIHPDVDRHAVIRAVAAHPQADRRELAAVDVDARRLAAALRRDAV